MHGDLSPKSHVPKPFYILNILGTALKPFIHTALLHVLWKFPWAENSELPLLWYDSDDFPSGLFAFASVSFVYSCPSDSFDHRNFISYKHMYICPWYLHINYFVNVMCIFEMAAILPNFFI